MWSANWPIELRKREPEAGFQAYACLFTREPHTNNKSFEGIFACARSHGGDDGASCAEGGKSRIFTPIQLIRRTMILPPTLYVPMAARAVGNVNKKATSSFVAVPPSLSITSIDPLVHEPWVEHEPGNARPPKPNYIL